MRHWDSADKTTWPVSGRRNRVARYISPKTYELGCSPQAQAAQGVAAAEEILVPMDQSILAGPANPAIAFRVLVIRSAGVMLDQLRPAVRAGAG